MKIVILLGRMSYCAAAGDRATSAPSFSREWAAFQESESQPNKERSRTPLAPAHCRTLKSEEMSMHKYGCSEPQAPHAGAPPIESARFNGLGGRNDDGAYGVGSKLTHCWRPCDGANAGIARAA